MQAQIEVVLFLSLSLFLCPSSVSHSFSFCSRIMDQNVGNKVVKVKSDDGCIGCAIHVRVETFEECMTSGPPRTRAAVEKMLAKSISPPEQMVFVQPKVLKTLGLKAKNFGAFATRKPRKGYSIPISRIPLLKSKFRGDNMHPLHPLIVEALLGGQITCHLKDDDERVDQDANGEPGPMEVENEMNYPVLVEVVDKDDE